MVLARVSQVRAQIISTACVRRITLSKPMQSKRSRPWHLPRKERRAMVPTKSPCCRGHAQSLGYDPQPPLHHPEHPVIGPRPLKNTTMCQEVAYKLRNGRMCLELQLDSRRGTSAKVQSHGSRGMTQHSASIADSVVITAKAALASPRNWRISASAVPQGPIHYLTSLAKVRSRT